MAITKRELIKLIEQLPEEANQSAFDYLKYLSTQYRPDWDEIEKMDPDPTPLSKEEKRQLNGNTEFLSWEEAMRELNLPTETKS